MKQGDPENNDPRHHNQKATEVRVHDYQVIKGMTDGHKTVKCHHR
jgi:hypothetical protein